MVMLPVMGLAAGMLTTVAGLGGGMLLVLVLSLAFEPAVALALTTPALLVGNLHRAWLFRHRLHRPLAWRFMAGALPGSLVGGAVVGLLPESALRWAMLVLMGGAVLVGTGGLRVKVPHRFVAPGALSIGVLSSAGGGAGLLAAPLLMGAGLSGETYLANIAASAFTTHLGRIVAYGASGLLPSSLLPACGALTVSVVTGNVLGRRLRGRLRDQTASRIEIWTLVASALAAVAGLLF